MDCVFLDDEAHLEETLPDLFDVGQVQMLTSNHCMLCSKLYNVSMLFGTDKQNCSRCGKSVCDNCSQAKVRLSKLEKKKHRVCDFCDSVLSNFKLD